MRIVAFVPSWWRVAVIALMQGAESKTNAINEKAVIGVNIVASSDIKFGASKMPRVATTSSLAMIPVNNAAMILQSPNPNGAKIHPVRVPRVARILYCISTICNLKLKLCKNHMAMVAGMITKAAR